MSKHYRVGKRAWVSRSVLEAARSFIERLQDKYPAAFPEKHKVPLKLGIRQDVFNQAKEWNVSEKAAATALTLWCSDPDYYKAVAAGGLRYDLDGNPSDEVTEEQQQTAETALRQARAKRFRRDEKKAGG